ncbi:MAG: hypothetical protein HYY28_15040 [Betaproteobacteria bacterium]|nr:hypothetical protein [Betaproteobacteria bacterium]MBI2961627.1 hypothetical protein [Betaproteobacteria bacterium]
MHTEVHVHGTVPLRPQAAQNELELALAPWLEYVDIENLSEARSANQDEPGVVFDKRRRVLEICWTGWVGRNFQRALDAAFEALSPYAEEAAGVEVTYYHEDGRDERGMAFVGPTPESILDAQRRAMGEDLTALLSRHFGEVEIREVVGLVDQIFDRRWAEGAPARDAGVSEHLPRHPGKKHLH